MREPTRYRLAVLTHQSERKVTMREPTRYRMVVLTSSVGAETELSAQAVTLVAAVVRRALRPIDEGILDSASVDDLANKLGLGSRHLRRLILQHVGASPISFAQTRRLQFAKRLLDETNLPITEIGLAAGFGSLRRFNTAFRQTYGRRHASFANTCAPTLRRTWEVE